MSHIDIYMWECDAMLVLLWIEMWIIFVDLGSPSLGNPHSPPDKWTCPLLSANSRHRASKRPVHLQAVARVPFARSARDLGDIFILYKTCCVINSAWDHWKKKLYIHKYSHGYGTAWSCVYAQSSKTEFIKKQTIVNMYISTYIYIHMYI